MPRFLLLLAVVLLPVSCWPAQAWNGRGHKIVSALAYDRLDVATQRRLADLLRHHPAFPSWRDAYDDDTTGVDFDRYLFMQASVWPDEIRRTESPYDHPAWHYADYPLTSPDFPLRDRPAPENDAVFGIARSLAVLRDADAPAEARAAHLSWLIHLLGDLHQPLHAAALTNEEYPEGDRGGNEFYVRASGQPVRLHSLWDGILGPAEMPADVMAAAAALNAAYPIGDLTEFGRATDPVAWSLESRAIAVEAVYRSGTLAGATAPAEAPELPGDYVAEAMNVAERRVVLAAFRLATLLGAGA